MKKLLNVVLCCCFIHTATFAQVDPHFSQYYVYPSWLNPALTGAIDGDYRVSGIYRSQWNAVGGFNTAGIAADMVTDKNINLGAAVMQQKAGNGGFTYTTAYFSVAYTGLKFGAEGFQRVVFGMQGGLIDRRFNSSKFQLGDQWNPITGFNGAATSLDQIPRNSSSVFDMGAGIMYYDAEPGKKMNLFAGFSAAHLTQPEDAFTDGKEKYKLPIRYTVHGGAKFNVNEDLSFVPNLLYLRQGTAEEKMAGLYAQIRANEVFDLLLGANYRFKDAIVPFAGFYYKNFVLGLSYDIPSSDLSKDVSNLNTIEISLSYIFRKSKELPGRHFVCPRL